MKIISSIDRKKHNQPGIYIIGSRKNNLVYVGATSSLRNRRSHHERDLILNQHHAPRLQQFCNDNPDEDLFLNLIEFCSKETLKEKEFYWINFYKSDDPEFGYNQRNHSGFTVDTVTREKIAKSLKATYKISVHPWLGRKQSQETKDKISKKHHDVKGKNNPIFGKKRSDETKKIISEAKKRNAAIRKANGQPNAHVGMKRSEETKRRISEARKRYYAAKKNISLSL